MNKPPSHGTSTKRPPQSTQPSPAHGRQIELLQEYRTRLIADVVTGKLDVREAAAHLPDGTDDQDPIEESSTLAEGLDEAHYDADESAMESEVTA